MLKHVSQILLATSLVAGTYYATFVYQPDSESGAQQMAEGRPGGGGSGGRPSIVETQQVAVTPYQDVFQAIGTVRANSRVLVQNEVAGKVLSSDLSPNTEVTQGDTLIRLEDRAATLSLRTARAELTEAEDALSRLETLASQGSSAVSSVQISEARTAVEIARANVETAEYELEQRSITAPIAGRLGLSDIEVGAYLGVGTEIVTITNLDDLRVDFSLPDRALDFLDAGLVLDVLLPTRPGTVYSAEVTGIDTEIDPETRQIDVEARIDSQAIPVLPGSVVTIIATRPSAPAPSVPSLAVSWGRQGASVWAVRDGSATRVPVEILHRDGDTVWLDADLADGTEIVVEGTQKVQEGGTVMTPDDARRMSRPANDQNAGLAGQEMAIARVNDGK
ncbi:efflux RND transporter periplasmic adaptor subunit [Paracoccus sp. Z330]|uniref:Efflux RND transporter periplasmic adaptor subunit n=1 Tax=Paracoccus onchidii TaxID=3017813 RepID=A0ABT4ZJK5_9RHOB|nr:efflux RND transporter periplasmic adaptor subunit [Paracoccus onchidii]MDB6179389.1 efflux RND transporter periplasmic adaptor subunit [Paracoccus onchidii]